MTAMGVKMRRSFLAIALGSAACARSPEISAETPGPTLELFGTVVLAESDSLLLSKPVGLAISTGNDRYIATDIAGGKVISWTATGILNNSWGRVGRGPGELSGPAAVVRSGRTLWVLDYGSQSWKQLDMQDGTQLASVPFTGSAGNDVLSEFSDTLWFGLRGANTVLGLLVPGNDSAIGFVRVPSIYTELAASGIGRISSITRAKTANATMLAFGALNGFYLLESDTLVTDSLLIPYARRRGMSASRLRASKGEFATLMNGISVLSSAAASSRPGEIITVHYDPTVAGTDVPRITARLFVSIINLNDRTACVDAEVSQTGDGRPVVQLVGDSLFVLRQTIVGTGVTTHVDQYIVSTATCQWLPMRRGALIDP